MQHVDHIPANWYNSTENRLFLVTIVDNFLPELGMIENGGLFGVATCAFVRIDYGPVEIRVVELRFGAFAPDTGVLGIGGLDAERVGEHLPVASRSRRRPSVDVRRRPARRSARSRR